ncbi:DUF1054 family protein [Leuconostocaceae bacterium ESL0958]|nr:DUF1054 family protein [Leuconostocaceae bacterium ESL0958]
MFQKTDFDLFQEQTLAGRMDRIRTIVDPKFEDFAAAALPLLKADGQDWQVHVAQHKMRKKNPPENTWVALAPNKRGYKMMPHFELGLWSDHLYLYLAVEENMKAQEQTAAIAARLAELRPMVAALPEDYCLSTQHMEKMQLPLADYEAAVARFERVKTAEVLVGVQVPVTSPLMGTPALDSYLLEVLQALLPLYEKIR